MCKHISETYFFCIFSKMRTILVCMPALGDHIKVGIDEVRKPTRADMLDMATLPKKSNLQQKPTKASNHDMLRYVKIC